MDIDNLTVILLAGDPKCLKLIPPDQAESYLTRASRATLALECPMILVHHPEVVSMKGAPSVRRVPAGRNVLESVMAGLQACQTDFALVVATDLPLINTPAIRDFLAKIGHDQSDVSIALADHEACRQLGHETRRPIPLDGRHYKFGSVFLLRTQARDQILSVYQELHGLRKQVVRLVLRFVPFTNIVKGLRFAATFKLKRLASSRLALRLSEVEDLVWCQTGLRVRGILASPSLVIDHD